MVFQPKIRKKYMYTTESWEVWGTIFFNIKSQIGKTDIERARCAVGTPLYFKEFL
jgi:hypothetical protein